MEHPANHVGDFAPHVGTAFAVADVAGVDLVLDKATPGPHQPGAPREHPFTLVFTGPAGLAQQTWLLRHPILGELAIFLVPIAEGRYEAVFN